MTWSSDVYVLETLLLENTLSYLCKIPHTAFGLSLAVDGVNRASTSSILLLF